MQILLSSEARPQQRGEDFDDGGLPSTVVTKQTAHRPGGNRKAHVSQCMYCTIERLGYAI